MDKPSRKILLSLNTAVMMRLIGTTSIYVNGEISLEFELRRVKSTLSDAEAKLKKAEADLKGSSKAKEALAKSREQLKTRRS